MGCRTRLKEESFIRMKSCLTSDTILGHFSPIADKTELVCDVSNVGLCGMLVQTNNGEKRVGKNVARTLCEVEKRYSKTEKEALWVVWACEKFRFFLIGLHFDIIVDHKAVEYIYSAKCARLERWVLRLMPFNFTVKTVSSKNNVVDALSRSEKKKRKRKTGLRMEIMYCTFYCGCSSPICAKSRRDWIRNSKRQ